MNKKTNIINIEDLENAKGKKLQVEFEDFIAEIKSDGPIKASLEAKSLGEFVEITGHVEGCAILECDLCLKEYEYEINFEIDELFAKNSFIKESEESGLEIELNEGEFVTDLKGSKEIDLYDLLYQSVILDFPNKKVCGIKCNGSDFLSEENFAENQIDPRLAVFKNINIEK